MSSGDEKKARAGPFEALRAMRDELRKREGEAKPRSQPRPAPAAARPARPPSDDDPLLFHRLFGGVTPLDRAPGRLPRQPVSRSAAAEEAARRGAEASRREAEAVDARLRALVEDGARFEVSDDGRRVEGKRVDIPSEALRRLRRGLFPIDARMDMHGMTVEQARGALEAFVRETRTRGERCVLVIHGKGEHSPGKVGALRGEIAAWLAQGPASHQVAAFATARERDGGEGAVYVLLRR